LRNLGILHHSRNVFSPRSPQQRDKGRSGPAALAQLDQIAEHVLCRLAERQRDEQRSRAANGVRASALPREEH